jgi:phage baseplate assembly protein W
MDYPFRIDARGRTARTDGDEHLRDQIHQVLFTSPGERVNRPEFGCGLKELLFAPNSDVLATATRFQVQGALQRWLGDRIDVEDLRIRADEERLVVDLAYVRRADGQRRRETFEATAGTGG